MFQNLAKQGKAAAPLVGISIPLTTDTGSESGSLDFGAPNPSVFTGELAFVPITSTAPSSEFWGIDQSIT
jgi:Eukaryotic aspartyl protease